MKTTKGNGHGKKITVAVLIIGAVTLAIVAARFIHHRMAYAVTDAVFVASDSLVTVEFDRVEGRLTTMTKKEGKPVAKGELLAAIDDTPTGWKRNGSPLSFPAPKKSWRHSGSPSPGCAATWHSRNGSQPAVSTS